MSPLDATGRVIVTELRDAAKRILWHWKLLILCAGLGFALPLFLLSGGDPTYVASTRFLVSTSAEGSTQIADTVSAIATSPSQLEWALRRVGLEADADPLVDGVVVRTIGESGVVQLYVAHDDPAFAAAVANALRVHVISLVHDPQDPIYSSARLLEPAKPSTAREVLPLRSQDLVLGVVLGMVLGVAIACVVEALSPTLVGKEAIARQLDAPILGVVSSRPDPMSGAVQWIRWRLGAQAARAGVATVELTAVDPRLDLSPISAALVTNGSSPPPPDVPTSNGSAKAFKLKVGILDASSILPGGSAGLVIVTPRVVKRSAFESTQELLRITGWPAMGAIVSTGFRGFPTVDGFGRSVWSAKRTATTSVRALTASGLRAPSAAVGEAAPVEAVADGRRKFPPWISR